MNPSDPVLEYHTPSPAPTRHSLYAVGSLVLAGISAVMLAEMMAGVSTLFDYRKEHLVGTMAALNGLLMGIAGCRRPRRKLGLAITGTCLSGVVFLIYFIAPPL